MASDTSFKAALLVVDMQEDFCPPNGSLAVPEGRDIAAGINKLLELPFALKVATRDWHPRDHVSFADNHPGPNNEPFKHKATMKNPQNTAETKESNLWPPHCVQNTQGAEIIPEINQTYFDAIVSKGEDARVEMYSAFNDIFGNIGGASTDLKALLQQHKISHVYMCGLAGEICVYENALGGRRAGFEVVFLKDLTRAVDNTALSSCMEHMEKQGIVVTESTGAEVTKLKESLNT